MQKVVGQQGQTRFLIDLDNGDKSPFEAMGCVVDIEQGKAYPPARLITIAAQGYWNEYRGGDEQAAGVLAIYDQSTSKSL